MDKITTIEGVAVPFRRSNVDTDQIIPAVYLKRVTKTGFDDALFYGWRQDPEFVLNQPAFQNPRILVAGPDFGTGSSREHAVWALDDYGFRCVIAPSFADIFFNNSFKNGFLPITLSEADIDELFARAAAQPRYELTVDLEKQQISDSQGFVRAFDVDSSRRHSLLHGLDDIAQTLLHEDKISQFELARAQ